MKAKYVGDPSNPGEAVPDLYDAFGVTFARDKFTEVPKELEEKIAGNNHFEVQGAKKTDPEAETGESTAAYASRIGQITDREGLEDMLKSEKRPAAKAALERRLAELPEAPAE
jgi:hypothetical protein